MGKNKSNKIKRFLKSSLFSSVSAFAPSVQASASASASPSANNCAGASATIRDLSNYLGDDIDQLELNSLDYEQSARLQELKAYGEERADYSTKVEGEWRCSSSTASLVTLAAHACAAVRSTDTPAVPRGFSSFQLVDTISSSLLRGIKATSVYRATREDGEEVVVVAVRAYEGKLDWMVNANCEIVGVGGDGGEMVVDINAFPQNSSARQLQAHCGFLHAARGSLPRVAEAIEHALGAPAPPVEEDGVHLLPSAPPRVLLTGHSAGGAVVGLLFAHFVTCAGNYPFLAPSQQQRQQQQQGATAAVIIPPDCITFGAPPIFSHDITPLLKPLSFAAQSAFLAIIIEGDPFPRLDLPYARFLCDLRPVGDAPPPALPLPTLHTLGDMILFRDKAAPGERRDTCAYLMGAGKLGRVAFSNFLVHWMGKYVEAVEEGVQLG